MSRNRFRIGSIAVLFAVVVLCVAVVGVLRVSSAGAERPLKRASDFARLLGSPVTVRLYKNRDGRKEFAGDLAGYEDGAVLLKVGEETLRFEKGDVALVRLRVDF